MAAIEKTLDGPVVADCCQIPPGQDGDISWSGLMRSRGQLSRDFAVVNDWTPGQAAKGSSAIVMRNSD